MNFLVRNKEGSVITEAALAIPIFLMMIFTLIEFGRTVYVLNTLNVAAQQVANSIAKNATRAGSYNLSNFGNFTANIYFPGSVINSNQFSFDVRDASNNSTVMNGLAPTNISTKVVVTVNFPPPSNPGYKIPLFDPGNLIGLPIFGINGLPLSASATCFLERSRRPILN